MWQLMPALVSFKLNDMMKRFLLPLLFLYGTVATVMAQVIPQAPEKIYGELFYDAQLNRIYPDNKTFVDCTPNKDPKDIAYTYQQIKNNPGIRFSLKLFLQENFTLPPEPPAFNYIQKEADITAHINNLWGVLKREAAQAAVKGEEWKSGSLLPLPNPYIVPGGRFREIYYWDSYFTMLGLKESGQTAMIENMIRNFAHLINTYGHIPNGNRSYYLSRSQPPFFSLMVDLLAGIQGDAVYKTYLPALEKEYNYWMDKTAATKHVVKMPDGSILNRYYDRDDVPRQESYFEDYSLSSKLPKAQAAALNRNLRSGAESGWDFSSRWFADEKNLSTIQVTDIIPVDLNSLLYNLESVLSKAKKLNGEIKAGKLYSTRAYKRWLAIEKYCWSSKQGYYFDYNTKLRVQSKMVTAAGIFPLCFINLYPESMDAKGSGAAKIIRQYLLKGGGIVTTPNNSGQQWDAPNGWAPLQWMMVWGLNRSGQAELAKDIASRWTALNEKVYTNTGKLMEKYNVIDTDTEAGGGEYPSQDGFGWTNGVYLAMKAMLGKK
jgi:alpha,alpha-trehalase